MASCKDCVCSEVCYYKAFNDEKHLKNRREDVEKICKSFVNRDRLNNVPTVDAVEVVHGQWIDIQFNPILKSMVATCSHCKVRGNVRVKSNECGFAVPDSDYCPNCGALMDGERREGE